MSASNLELLAQAFAGWGKDNPANMVDLLDPDCELIVPDSIDYGGAFKGADAVIGWFTKELVASHGGGRHWSIRSSPARSAAS